MPPEMSMTGAATGVEGTGGSMFDPQEYTSAKGGTDSLHHSVLSVSEIDRSYGNLVFPQPERLLVIPAVKVLPGKYPVNSLKRAIPNETRQGKPDLTPV